MLECEYYGNRYCIKCLKLKPGESETMGKPGCMWFCLKWKPKVKKSIYVKVVEERCEFYFKTMNKRLDAIKSYIRNAIEESKINRKAGNGCKLCIHAK